MADRVLESDKQRSRHVTRGHLRAYSSVQCVTETACTEIAMMCGRPCMKLLEPMYTRMHVCIYVCMHVYTYVCMHVCSEKLK